MTTITRSIIYLPMAAMILTTALASPLAAGEQVPFKGAMQGAEIEAPQGGPPPTTLSVSGRVTGIASHLGEFSLTYQVTVNLPDGTAIGSALFIAANGDTISTAVAGSSEATATPNVASITEINTIMGGTGRFAGAKGSFTVERLVNLVTGFTSGSFHGTITSPGLAH
jgi:hypothetical protein